MRLMMANNSQNKPLQRHTANTGFSLLEVMVALMILSVGLLALAGLQLMGLQLNQQSFFRDQTATMAYDMADRMRANTTATIDGNYDNPTGVNNSCVQVGSTPPSNCNVAEMAVHDFWEWNQSLAQYLPNGSGQVCLDSDATDTTLCDGAGTTYTIYVNWTENEEGGQVQKTFSLRLAPPV